MNNKIEKKKFKPDAVLTIAWILAMVSAFFVYPGKEYLEYIDFRSLGILWGLMVIIQGFKENTVFVKIAGFLLSKVKNGWQLAAVLVFMCFISSMFITNDVALITFVPFALMILHGCDREDMMIPTVVLQTVAANLGSMLTPIGNPQNLYLYGLTGMGLGEFILTLLPYSMISVLLLCIAIFLMTPDKEKGLSTDKDSVVTGNFGSERQIISNVPATLMLSGFTTNYKELLLGVNIGGMGTLIASMASLISYKVYSKEYREKSGKYLLVFTAVNVAFLIVLVLVKVAKGDGVYGPYVNGPGGRGLWPICLNYFQRSRLVPY